MSEVATIAGTPGREDVVHVVDAEGVGDGFVVVVAVLEDFGVEDSEGVEVGFEEEVVTVAEDLDV